MRWTDVAVEGIADLAVARAILSSAGIEVAREFVAEGKSKIDARIQQWNEAARHGHWFVLRDLDHDAGCPPTLIQDLLPSGANPFMCFRIATRAAEAWLLADHAAIAKFLGVSQSVIPPDPEQLDDPKRFIVTLAGRSRKRAIREDMTPAPGTTAKVGPGYSGRIIEFAEQRWRPSAAAERSQSLARCLQALVRT